MDCHVKRILFKLKKCMQKNSLKTWIAPREVSQYLQRKYREISDHENFNFIHGCLSFISSSGAGTAGFMNDFMNYISS